MMLFYGFRVVKEAALFIVSLPISTTYGKVCVFDRPTMPILPAISWIKKGPSLYYKYVHETMTVGRIWEQQFDFKMFWQ